MRLSVFVLLFLCCHISSASATGMEMNARQFMVDLHQLEWQSGGDAKLEMESWYGDEFNKWLVDIEVEKDSSEDTHGEITVGYRQAISPFFDAGLIVRREHDDEDRNWTGFRVSGTAPYFVHTNLDLLIHQGEVLLDVKLEHELPLSRQWVIKTKISYEALLSGGGSQDAEVGLRIVYETPDRWGLYVGYEWQASFEENDVDQVVVTGISYWF